MAQMLRDMGDDVFILLAGVFALTFVVCILVDKVTDKIKRRKGGKDAGTGGV